MTNQIALSNLTISAYFKQLSNGLSTPLILHCPADVERKKSTSFATMDDRNVSYFADIGASENRPQDWLAGDRNLLVNSSMRFGLVRLDQVDEVRWSEALHRNQGNLAMGDGSVQQLRSSRLSPATNLLLFPDRLKH